MDAGKLWITSMYWRYASTSFAVEGFDATNILSPKSTKQFNTEIVYVIHMGSFYSPLPRQQSLPLVPEDLHSTLLPLQAKDQHIFCSPKLPLENEV